MTEEFNRNYRTWHTRISYAKSSLRLAGCICAGLSHADPQFALLVLAISFGVAELLGIAEEWI